MKTWRHPVNRPQINLALDQSGSWTWYHRIKVIFNWFINKNVIPGFETFLATGRSSGKTSAIHQSVCARGTQVLSTARHLLRCLQCIDYAQKDTAVVNFVNRERYQFRFVGLVYRIVKVSGTNPTYSYSPVNFVLRTWESNLLSIVSTHQFKSDNTSSYKHHVFWNLL